jgi:rubrerythrin
MARYIDADFVTASINRVLEERKTEKETTAYFAFEQFKFLLGQAPTEDVVEVKHGKWLKVQELSPRYVCTNCRHLFSNMGYKYCPNCGAKMKAESALKEREMG